MRAILEPANVWRSAVEVDLLRRIEDVVDGQQFVLRACYRAQESISARKMKSSSTESSRHYESLACDQAASARGVIFLISGVNIASTKLRHQRNGREDPKSSGQDGVVVSFKQAASLSRRCSCQLRSTGTKHPSSVQPYEQATAW